MKHVHVVDLRNKITNLTFREYEPGSGESPRKASPAKSKKIPNVPEKPKQQQKSMTDITCSEKITKGNAMEKLEDIFTSEGSDDDDDDTSSVRTGILFINSFGSKFL